MENFSVYRIREKNIELKNVEAIERVKRIFFLNFLLLFESKICKYFNKKWEKNEMIFAPEMEINYNLIK